MKRLMAVTLCVVLVATIFGGCTKGQTAKVKTVTDLNGNIVELPQEITGASSNSASVTSQIVMVGGADLVKIAPSSFSTGHTEKFEELFDGTKDIKLAEGNKISAEALLEAGVNVFFTTKQSDADEYSNSGLTCIVLNFDTTENIARTFEIMGEIFGGDALEKSKKISEYILDYKKIVEENLDGISEQEKPTVYYISASTQTTPYLTQGEGTSTNKLLDICGANQVTSGTGLDVTVNAEFILEKDPDYILIDGYLAEEARTELINDTVLKELTAVKEGRIILAPVGFFRPYLRPGAESGLGLLWLAKEFCPELMTDVSVEDSAKEFYRECFGWDVDLDEIKKSLNEAD